MIMKNKYHKPKIKEIKLNIKFWEDKSQYISMFDVHAVSFCNDACTSNCPGDCWFL